MCWRKDKRPISYGCGKENPGWWGHRLAQIPFRLYLSIHPPPFLLVGTRPPPPSFRFLQSRRNRPVVFCLLHISHATKRTKPSQKLSASWKNLCVVGNTGSSSFVPSKNSKAGGIIRFRLPCSTPDIHQFNLSTIHSE